MTYGKITIDSYGVNLKNAHVNLGNRLIEHAISILLNLKPADALVSMFKIPSQVEIDKLNTCDFVLLPGSTILADAPGNSDVLNLLDKIKVPKLCVAASCWGPRYKPYVSAMKNITPPIGCRDPYTLNVCKSLGIPAILTGCPTAYLPLQKNTPTVPYSIVGFARTHIDWQVNLFNKLNGKVVSAIQENKFEVPIARRVCSDIFTYEDPINVMRHYAEAKQVITGRLHGVLPALSQHKDVMFFGDNRDTRFSLLEYLNIDVCTMVNSKKITLQNKSVYSDKLAELKSNFYKWARTFGL